MAIDTVTRSSLAVARGGIGPRMYAIGDSIISQDAPSVAAFYGAKNAVVWSTILSQGKLRFTGISGTGGFTTAQVLATHLPNALAAAPDFCLVLCGLNDFTATPFATTTANLTTMYRSLLAAGITPVACTLLPQNNTVGKRGQIHQLNQWIKRYAAVNGIPVVDFYTNLVDHTTGSMQAAYTSDGTHPSAAGAQVMGQAIVDQLLYAVRPWSPQLVEEIQDQFQVTNTSNGVLTLDTNADGVPDLWANLGLDGTVANSLVSASNPAKGNWLRINKTVGTGTSSLQSTSGAVTAGDSVLVGFRFRMASTGGGSAKVFLADSASATIASFVPFQFNLACPDTLFVFPPFTVPVGVTGVRFCFGITGGPGDASVAQPTIYNLTAMGITV